MPSGVDLHQNRRSNVCNSELRENPCARSLDITRRAGHVRQEWRPTEHDWIIANHTCQYKEEDVEIEEQASTVLPSLLKHLEREVSNETRRVD